MRNDQTVNVDVNISPEEIARLGATRPFWKFVNFPIVLSDKTYTFPSDYDFTEKIDMTPLKLPLFCSCKKPELKNPSGACGCNWCVKCNGKITCVRPVTWTPLPGGVKGIGPKPEPIKIEVKETYVSPFSGRVM